MEAEVKALLTLDATGFNNSMSNIMKKVEKFTTTISSVGENSKGFVSGLRQIRDEMSILNEAFAKLEVSTQKAMDFKRIADGMQKLVNTARQLRDDNISLEGTYQALGNVAKMFAGVLGEQEIKLKGNLSLTRQVAESNRQISQSTYNVSQAFEREVQDLLNVGQAVNRYSADVLKAKNSHQQYMTALQNPAPVTYLNRLSQFGSKLSSVESIMRTNTLAVQQYNTALQNPAPVTYLNRLTQFNSRLSGVESITKANIVAVQQYNNALQNPAPVTYLNNLNLIKTALSGVEAITNQVINATRMYNEALSNPTPFNFINTNNAMGNSLSNLGLRMNTTSTNAKNMSTSFQGIPVTMNGTSQATKYLNQNLNSSSNTMNKMSTTTRGLTGGLSSLRTMLSMVGSMFLYNFAHNMMISVSNTVKAKSEMQSYLQTMGMTKAQIEHFNIALDQTADRFQRINKYNIGETVANIGLEFNLSAQEMEKAMSVTSMITSEYLRAGRNADEAALAVKDIMQGQFQRLSRETGVKGETLKEFGWSGDENDVMGLMDALEKAAKSRHWDIFAEKANSLNDIVLITQNRLSEWATDMSEGIVPIITGSFNALVNAVDKVTDFFTSLGKALNLPDWTGTAVILAGITATIGALVLGTITWRTQMGLLQIAHQGLKQSIVATVFGIKAEEMANVSATTVLKAKLLGVQAETLAQQGLINILKAKVLGLDAEVVAQKGVATAIHETNNKRLLEDVLGKKVKSNNVSLLSSYVALKRGLDLSEVSGLKWYQTLAMLNPQISKMKAQNMGVIDSLKAFTSTLNATRIATSLLTASILTLTSVAVIGYTMATMDSAKTMKNFNDMAENGEEKIRKVKNAFGEGSQEAKNMTEAVEKVRSALGKFDDRKNTASQRAGRTVAKYLEEAGTDEEKIREITDSALRDANRGVSIVAKTGDEIEKTYRGAANAVGLMKDKLKGDEYDEYAEKMLTSADRIAIAQEKMMMSDSAIDRAFGWFDFTVEQMGHWWNEFSKNLEHQDYGEAWGNIWKGFMNGFGKLPIASDIWNTLFKSINLEDHIVKGDLGASLGKMGTDLGNWMLKTITDSFTGENKWSLVGIISSSLQDLFNNVGGNMHEVATGLVKAIFEPLNNIGENLHNAVSGIWNQITEAFSNFFSGGEGGGGGLLPQKIDTSWLLKSLFGFVDSTGIGEWFTNDVILPIQEFLSTIDIASLLTASPVDVFGALLNMIFGEGTYEQINAYIQANIITPLMNLPLAVQTYLTTAVGNFINFASLLLQYGMSAGSNFLNGVVGFISQLPSRVYSYITSTASHIISGASQWVSNARSKASETVNAVITQVSQLPDKVYNEFMKIANRIRDAISSAVQAATQFGSDIVNAVLGALHIASPGIIQEKIATEFANIGGRIAENREDAQNEASLYGQSIVDGMDTQIGNIQNTASMYSTAMAQVQPMTDGSFVADYESDAYALYGINQTMAMDTSMTFTAMGDTVNGTIDGISTNLQTSYLNMNTNQTLALTTMQNQNRTAFTNLQNQTSTSLNNMRSTTQNVTVQMVNAWNHMKDNIIASANQLKTQSTAHFNTLSSHIGDFYRKLQNPSMWGGGDPVPRRHYSPHRGLRGANEVKRAFGVPVSGGKSVGGRKYAGGYNLDNMPETMTLRKLRSLVGNNSLFKGMDLDKEVNVAEFLSQFDGSFGWADWHGTHFNHIKSTSGEWRMRGPQIMHRIDTGQSFQVKEFYNGRPNIPFSGFQSVAEALFSAIPYDFYYNSDKYGSWVNALQAGACNCYDGANAIIALASVFGFSGTMQSGTWNGIPHVYAVIEGKKMDTTGWQNRRDWNGVSAGSPSNMKGFGETKTYNIIIDMNNPTFYGEDDFRTKMEDIAEEVLRKEVNTSITVGI